MGFDGLDGQAKWAEAPARPEAGGKELVTLKSKDDREKEMIALDKGSSRRSEKGANIPAAAMKMVKQVRESRADRCRRLLSSMEPPVESDIVDYVVSMVDEDSCDDIGDVKESAFEILEGYGVEESTAEAFWVALLAI